MAHIQKTANRIKQLSGFREDKLQEIEETRQSVSMKLGEIKKEWKRDYLLFMNLWKKNSQEITSMINEKYVKLKKQNSILQTSLANERVRKHSPSVATRQLNKLLAAKLSEGASLRRAGVVMNVRREDYSRHISKWDVFMPINPSLFMQIITCMRSLTSKSTRRR